jgi:murein DD-endopeptidase MepM/ murein hydrolase activator NlpD
LPAFSLKMKVLLLSILCFLLSPSAQASLEIILSTTTPLPGESLRLIAEGVTPTEKTRVIFHKGFYPLFTIGPDAQRALIGVKLDAMPGSYGYKIQQFMKRVGRWETISEGSVEVASRTFVIENINFSKTKSDLQRWEKQESARIRKLLMTVTQDQNWEGTFDFPVQGPIVGEFGLKRMRNGKAAGFHKGYDIKAKTGTPILAPAAGTVLMAATLKAHGKTVLVNHGQGVMTIYLHMSSMSVVPDQKVVKGQKLGAVGSTGLSTAPHVHWGLYVHGVAVDARPWTETEF